jgi:hypothetical protein
MNVNECDGAAKSQSRFATCLCTVPSVKSFCSNDRAKTCSRYGRNSKCRVRSKLRSESVGVKPYRYWGLPGYRYHWRVERPHQPADRRRMSRRKTPHQTTKSFSVRRKSPTSVCRRSMSSTKKTPQHLRSARKLPGVAGAAAAAAGAAAADAVGEAAGAVAAEAAARPGVVAAGARSAHRPTALTEPNTHNGRVLLDPASFCLICARRSAAIGPSTQST